jgi:hypothetical protein
MRFFSYLCLSLALALALGPYSDQRKFLENSPRVLVSALALTEEGLASACSGVVYDLSEESLAGNEAMAQAVGGLGRDLKKSNYAFLETAAAARFIQEITGSPQPEVCFRSQGRTFKVIVSGFSGYSDFFLVGINPDQIQDLPVVAPERLKDLPGVSGYLAGLTRHTGVEPVFDQAETEIEAGEWRNLTSGLNLAGAETAVRVGDFVLYGVVEDHRVERIVVLRGLRAGRLVLAILLLPAGVWLWRGLYRRRPGFSSGAAWTALTGDALLILVGTAGAYSLVEVVQGYWFAAEPWLPKSLVIRYLTWGYLPYLALCAWLKVKAVSWGLEVTGMGLVKHGPGRARIMVWDEIESLGRRRESGRVGPDLLVIGLKPGEDAIPLPSRAGDRMALVSVLKELAPPRLQEGLRGLFP